MLVVKILSPRPVSRNEHFVFSLVAVHGMSRTEQTTLDAACRRLEERFGVSTTLVC